MIIVITSDGDKRHALRRLISPFSSNIRCQLGKNNFEKSSTSQYVSTNLFMLVPFCSNHSWSNDRIMERAFSSFKLVISYPKLRLTTGVIATGKQLKYSKIVISCRLLAGFFRCSFSILYFWSSLHTVKSTIKRTK